MKWILTAIAISIVLATVGYMSCKRIRSINTPDPATFPPERIEKALAAYGLQAKVGAVRYVQLDFNAYIFEGEFVGNMVKLPVFPDADQELHISDYKNLFPDRFGVVYCYAVSGKTLWGIALSTTQSEWDQGKPYFDDEWKRAVANLTRR